MRIVEILIVCYTLAIAAQGDDPSRPWMYEGWGQYNNVTYDITITEVDHAGADNRLLTLQLKARVSISTKLITADENNHYMLDLEYHSIQLFRDGKPHPENVPKSVKASTKNYGQGVDSDFRVICSTEAETLRWAALFARYVRSTNSIIYSVVPSESRIIFYPGSRWKSPLIHEREEIIMQIDSCTQAISGDPDVIKMSILTYPGANKESRSVGQVIMSNNGLINSYHLDGRDPDTGIGRSFKLEKTAQD